VWSVYNQSDTPRERVQPYALEALPTSQPSDAQEGAGDSTVEGARGVGSSSSSEDDEQLGTTSKKKQGKAPRAAGQSQRASLVEDLLVGLYKLNSVEPIIA
jgi:hypothetical protein